MKHYKAIVYDLDGTLIDTMDMNLYPLLQIIREERGEEWTLEQLLPFFFQPGLKTMEDLQIRDKETTYARWVRYVNEYQPGAIPFPGILQMLETFRSAGIRQAAVSSKMRRQYEIDVVDKGLGDYLETAVLADDTVHHKPHPEPIWECIHRLGLLPEDVLYVGDAPSDLEAAHNAGVDFGFAAWGALLTEGMDDAQFYFHTPEDLLHLLPQKTIPCR